MTITPLVCATNFSLQRGNKYLIQDCNFTIPNASALWLTGPSGSGKTSLAQALAGHYYYQGQLQFNFNSDTFSEPVTLVSQYCQFKDNSGLSEFYYQQRYNSYDAENTPTVAEYLGIQANCRRQAQLIKLLRLESKLNTSLIQLSSGERKKLQLVMALAKPSQLLILDNPYIGLDQPAIANLNHYLQRLVHDQHSVLIISDSQFIPEFISSVLFINEHLKLEQIARKDFKPRRNGSNQEPDLTALCKLLPPQANASAAIVNFQQVTIKYGDKRVLDQVNWQITAGEKWLLAGPNGAGKSTLLSLIYGDHPQAYANNIYLFERKRGSGETIWEIKQKIGYVSPELHWNFNREQNCLQTVVSGFYDTPGLYTQATEQQYQVAHAWLQSLNLTQYALQPFYQLAAGTQRLLLLIRALIKNPQLLILDEPCQGLDEEQATLFIKLMDQILANSHQALIYVSHRSDQIPACINHHLQLQDGKVIN